MRRYDAFKSLHEDYYVIDPTDLWHAYKIYDVPPMWGVATAQAESGITVGGHVEIGAMQWHHDYFGPTSDRAGDKKQFWGAGIMHDKDMAEYIHVRERSIRRNPNSPENWNNNGYGPMGITAVDYQHQVEAFDGGAMRPLNHYLVAAKLQATLMRLFTNRDGEPMMDKVGTAYHMGPGYVQAHGVDDYGRRMVKSFNKWNNRFPHVIW